ncbi:MAG: recombinase family protein [Faecousia sp.]
MARKSRQPLQQGILPASSSNENTATVYRTGIYARLSNKNFMSTDVDVLGNQLNHLRDYVASHDDMALVDTYIDDGWCGSSFNRPDFNRMMADVKSGRINCIVVRDFSRFGRNYLEMGYYLNEVFPSYNLRFISIFDDFDSLVSDADSMLFSMMQIVNDFYSKDISRKICAVYDAKVSKGFCWGSIPYGYFRRKDGTGRLLMDENTAPIVYLAYYWLDHGVSPAQAARNLNLLGFRYEGPPSMNSDESDQRKSDEILWTAYHLYQFLHNPLYTGDTVYNRFRDRKYDSSHYGKMSMDEWKYVPDTHPAYRSKERYQKTIAALKERSKLLSAGKQRMSITVDAPKNPFRYLLYCGACQYPMTGKKDETGFVTAYQCIGRHHINVNEHEGYSIQRDLLMQSVARQLLRQQEEAQKYLALLEALPMDAVCSQLEERRACLLRDLCQEAEAIENSADRAKQDYKDKLLEADVYQLQMEKLDMMRSVNSETQETLRAQLTELRHILSPDNAWLRDFSDLSFSDEVPSTTIHQLTQRIEVTENLSVTITLVHAEQRKKLQGYLDEWVQLQKEGQHG